MMQPKKNQEQRMTLNDRTAWTLPRNMRGIRVLSGEAWVSIGLEDVIVNTQETLYIHPNRHGAVITALGHHRLEFELIA